MWKILALVFFLVSCSQIRPAQKNSTTNNRKKTYTHKKIKSEAKPQKESPETPQKDLQLLRKIKLKNTVVIDVRDVNEFVNGHVKGAVHLDFLKTGFESKVAKLDPKKTYLLYCSGGRAGKAIHYFWARKIKAENLGTFEELKTRGVLMEGIEEQ